MQGIGDFRFVGVSIFKNIIAIHNSTVYVHDFAKREFRTICIGIKGAQVKGFLQNWLYSVGKV